VPSEKFEEWAAQTRGAGPVLDAQAYADLAKPSKAVAPFTYRAVAPNLFGSIADSAMTADASSPVTRSTSQRAER